MESRSIGWDPVAHLFHAQVKAACLDPLTGRLLKLHQPHVHQGSPVCRGCDQRELRSVEPVWPCRTYTIIASVLLDCLDIPGLLAERLRQSEHCDSTGEPR